MVNSLPHRCSKAVDCQARTTNYSSGQVTLATNGLYIKRFPIVYRQCQVSASRDDAGNSNEESPPDPMPDVSSAVLWSDESVSINFNIRPQPSDRKGGAHDGPRISANAPPSDVGKAVAAAVAAGKLQPLDAVEYPDTRTFTAIGLGGDDFKRSMVQAVESVLGPLHEEAINITQSSRGKYVSVRLGPVVVPSADHTRRIFCEMKKDSRLKVNM